MTALDGILARNRAGEAVGLPSFCTAHPETLAAILRCYRNDDAPVLIEATCNQVNQSGGYTGLTPAAFRSLVNGIARAQGVAGLAAPRTRERLVEQPLDRRIVLRQFGRDLDHRRLRCSSTSTARSR